jgi:lipopolysaccharide transport system permease protein
VRQVVESIATYEPDNSLKKGYLSIFSEIFDEVKKNRWLIYQLFRRDLYTTYGQSIFGVLWTFIVPLVSVGTFVILNVSGLFNVGEINVPYPIYALLGFAFWQLFSNGLVASSNSLVRAGSMIVKINFSKKALVISSMGLAMVSFLVQFALTFVLFAFYGILPSLVILLVPLFIIPLLLLTFGIGLMLSILNAVVRDFGTLLSIGMTFLLFLTPILYVRPQTGILALISAYNPLYYLVSVPRDLILGISVTTAGWFGLLFSTVLSVIIFVACLVAFHQAEARIAERV